MLLASTVKIILLTNVVCSHLHAKLKKKKEHILTEAESRVVGSRGREGLGRGELGHTAMGLDRSSGGSSGAQ